MSDEGVFEGQPLALSVAESIEGCALSALQNMQCLRFSYQAGRGLLEDRPANIDSSEERRAFWGNLDRNVNCVTRTAVGAFKTIHQVFAYFPRFRTSMELFRQCALRGVDPGRASEMVQKDLSEFQALVKACEESWEGLEERTIGAICDSTAQSIGENSIANKEELMQFQKDVHSANERLREALENESEATLPFSSALAQMRSEEAGLCVEKELYSDRKTDFRTAVERVRQQKELYSRRAADASDHKTERGSSESGWWLWKKRNNWTKQVFTGEKTKFLESVKMHRNEEELMLKRQKNSAEELKRVEEALAKVRQDIVVQSESLSKVRQTHEKLIKDARDVLDAAVLARENAINKITAATAKSGVGKERLPQFLRVCKDLVESSTSSVESANQLFAGIQTFLHDVSAALSIAMQRDSIRYYFDRYTTLPVEYVEALEEELGVLTMDDLVCADKEEFEADFAPIYAGVAERLGRKTVPTRVLRNLSLKPQSWQKKISTDASDETMKLQLDTLGALTRFFGEVTRGVAQGARHLKIQSAEMDQLESPQIDAIEYVPSSSEERSETGDE